LGIRHFRVIDPPGSAIRWRLPGVGPTVPGW
jgi:hypothetical protein